MLQVQKLCQMGWIGAHLLFKFSLQPAFIEPCIMKYPVWKHPTCWIKGRLRVTKKSELVHCLKGGVRGEEYLLTERENETGYTVTPDCHILRKRVPLGQTYAIISKCTKQDLYSAVPYPTWNRSLFFSHMFAVAEPSEKYNYCFTSEKFKEENHAQRESICTPWYKHAWKERAKTTEIAFAIKSKKSWLPPAFNILFSVKPCFPTLLNLSCCLGEQPNSDYHTVCSIFL